MFKENGGNLLIFVGEICEFNSLSFIFNYF
jgi:hypothetical protein